MFYFNLARKKIKKFVARVKRGEFSFCFWGDAGLRDVGHGTAGRETARLRDTGHGTWDAGRGTWEGGVVIFGSGFRVGCGICRPTSGPGLRRRLGARR